MNKKRLPQSTYPIRYEVELDVDLDNFTYSGKELIDIEVLENTNEIVLNCIGIEVISAKIQNNKQEVSLSIIYIEEDEKIIFQSKDALSKGQYKLYLEFKSGITDDLKGFYKSLSLIHI